MLDALKQLVRRIKTTMGIYEPTEGQVYGLLAEFSNPGMLLHAAEEVRAKGYRKFDTHSPFPIHGMDRAMGLGQSKVGPVVFMSALIGCAAGLFMQYWMNGFDYPLNISGKPYFALEPSVPITFEVTILFSALAAVAGMLAFNGLPRPYNPLFYSKNFSRATDDAFFLHVAASDDAFDLDETRSLLTSVGATNVEVIEDYVASEGNGAVRTADQLRVEKI